MSSILVRLTRQENATHYGVSVGDSVSVPLEDYVAGVVASEIGNAHIEACRAQAIAARTFAHPYYSKGKTITDASSSHQAFRALRVVSGLYPNAVQAASDTAGMLLTYEGKVLSTCSYSASNGGRTVSSEERWGGVRPWLIAQDDPWDYAASNGKKNGHGVGMSQVGMKYAASIGKTFREILAFYYPGTSILDPNAQDDPHKEVKPMSERILIPFTNEHFAQFCRQMEGEPYWYGTCVYKCTSSLLASKSRQYPSHYGSSRTSRYKDDIAKKKVASDCVGGCKGYAWTNGGVGVLEAIGTDNKLTKKYGSNGCPDKSANGMFTWAKSKGMPWGTIDTMPEIVGLAVRFDGHIGYYIGNGEVSEWRGFAYGNQITKLSKRKWTHWFQLPFLNYGDANISLAPPAVTTPTLTDVPLGNRLLKKGMSGTDVKALQELLLQLGYKLPKYGADGDYGAETMAAVKAFQKAEGLPQDGLYGDKTHAELMDAVADDEQAKDEVQDAEPDNDDPTVEAPETEEKPAAPRVEIISGNKVNIRVGNDTKYSRITQVVGGTTFEWIATAANGWHAVVVGSRIGWVSGKYSRVI